MADPVILENDSLRALITPEQGAGMLGLFLKKDGEWLPLMPDAREARHELKWCNWMMIPYSNRIENGAFAFDGRKFQLGNGENHAIHGDCRNRPWCPEDVNDTYIRCDFQSTAHKGFNWPWKIEARGEYEVMDNVFSMRMWLWNRDETAMPAGFGWHPYFSRWLTRRGEPAMMTMNVHGVYPDANDNRIPSGPPSPPAAAVDFSQEKEVDPGNFFDACCCGYDGEGSIRWPESGVEIVFDCTPNLSHLVIYNPVGKEYFAAEPVSNANNGVNLFDQGDPTSGIVVLQPGESIEARFDLVVEVR